MTKRKHFDYCRAQTQNSEMTIISKKELAEMLGVSRSTIYRMVKNGLLPTPMLTSKNYIQGWSIKTIKAWQAAVQRF